MKKPNFPAKFIKDIDGRRAYLCRKHLEMHDTSGAKALPDDHGMSCEECVADRING